MEWACGSAKEYLMNRQSIGERRFLVNRLLPKSLSTHLPGPPRGGLSEESRHLLRSLWDAPMTLMTVPGPGTEL